MRKSVSTAEVLDFYSNKLQSEAYASQSWNQSGFSLKYGEDGILYSYSRYMPFARWVTNQNGVEALLITSRTDGMASGHLWRLNAASQHVRKIHAPLVLSDNHAEQFANWKADAELLIDRVKRCRKLNRIIQFFEDIKVQSADYADFFGIAVPDELTEILNMQGESVDAIRERIEKAKAQQIVDDRKALKAHLESVKAFRENRNHWVVRYYGQNFKDKAVMHNILRYDDTRHIVQTSGGVQIPYTSAKRFYQTIFRARRDGVLDSLIGKSIKASFGHDYVVKRVTPTGLFIGCHEVPFSEIDIIAKQLDWNNPKVLGIDS